jgi:GMP synthase-like glutamine amidotransferase
MPKLLFIQHGDVDKPGLLADGLWDMGIELEVIHPYSGDPVPSHPSGFAGLAFGGGGQSAYDVDSHPYLEAECALIRTAVDLQMPLLGLCLGAQLIARALGAEVRAAEQKEIGFYPVTLSHEAIEDPLVGLLPPNFSVTHWHGDVFDIPLGAVHMASSKLTPNQSFRYGKNCYGFQFHLEMTPPLFEELVWDSEEYLVGSGHEPTALIRESKEVLPGLEPHARGFFQRWAALL